VDDGREQIIEERVSADHERPAGGRRCTLRARATVGKLASFGRSYPASLLLLPAVALCIIAAVDLILEQRPLPLLIDGTLDEVGHLLTAALLLAVLPRSARRRLWPWTLLGAVAIDIDHVPLYTFAHEFAVDGRPPTHSAMTVLILAVVAAVIPAVRIPFAGLALGVCLHFVRDIATGPGVPLFWPFDDVAERAPYPVYLAVIAGTAGVATWRIYRDTRPRGDPAL
jgi:inner membrane protein